MENLMNEIINIHPMKSFQFIDVGARWGLQRPWNNFPTKFFKYFGFDADVEECNRLNSAVPENHAIKYFPFALSDKEIVETLYITKEEGRSAIYKPNNSYLNKFYENDGFKVKNKVEVKTMTLKKIFNDHKIEPDFIKLDTQGAELKILKGAGRYLDALVGIEIEVEFTPIYQNQPLFHNVDSLLRSNGFELFDLNRYWAKQKTLDKHHSTRGQIIFADAIYFRSIDSFFSNDFKNKDEKKEKFIKVICALSLYGFFDKAIDYCRHSKAPLKKTDLKLIENELECFSSYPGWQTILLNNNVSLYLGLMFKYLSNFLLYKRKCDGWGSDYNTTDGRYSYFSSEKVNKYFGRK